MNLLGNVMGAALGVSTGPRTIEDVTQDILRSKAQAARAFIDIGKGLIEAKELLPHGEWLPWLHDRVQFTPRHAQNFMQLAKEYANTKSISHLDMTKAKLVLELPAQEREEFITTPHVVGGAEKMPAEMTTREMKQVINEKAAPKKGAPAAPGDEVRPADDEPVAVVSPPPTPKVTYGDLLRTATREEQSRILAHEWGMTPGAVAAWLGREAKKRSGGEYEK